MERWGDGPGPRRISTILAGTRDGNVSWTCLLAVREGL